MGQARRALDTLHGIEASRRVGWAKYYNAEEEIAALRSALYALAEAVIYHPRIHGEDPIIEQAQKGLST